jgi:hypothetical protein
MFAATAVLVAVIGALVFVMRMDEDPTRWRGMKATGRHRHADAAAAKAPDTGS